MFKEPVRLGPGSVIDGFVPDASGAWVVAYAAPCENACEDAHLYLVPMIGWHQIVMQGHEDMTLRPAVMAHNGRISDYLDIPKEVRFIAVLPAGEDVVQMAVAIFHDRYGDKQTLRGGGIEQRVPN